MPITLLNSPGTRYTSTNRTTAAMMSVAAQQVAQAAARGAAFFRVGEPAETDRGCSTDLIVSDVSHAENSEITTPLRTLSTVLPADRRKNAPRFRSTLLGEPSQVESAHRPSCSVRLVAANLSRQAHAMRTQQSARLMGTSSALIPGADGYVCTARQASSRLPIAPKQHPTTTTIIHLHSPVAARWFPEWAADADSPAE